MKTILVLMDTLRRNELPCYNPSSCVKTPNLDEFAEESTIFDNHWIGSAPCMPARRDILTGRLNFLERSWGPIEPFDVTLQLTIATIFVLAVKVICNCLIHGITIVDKRATLGFLG